MGKRKSTEDEIHATCQSIGKKLAALSDMIRDGDLASVLTADITALPAPVYEPKKQRVAKPAKDPHAPTRNLTSYIHYTNDNRKKIVAANPGMAPRDVARTLGEGWRNLSAKEKARYDQLAKDDLKRYNDEMKAYKETGVGDSDNDHNNSSNDSGSNDERYELASDDQPPKVKQSAKKTGTTKPSAKAKTSLPKHEDDDASDSSSSSSSSSSEDSSSSSDSSDSDEE